MIDDGPFKNAIERKNRNILKEEYICYEIKNGILVKSITERRHFNDGDYVDGSRDEPLSKGERFESSVNKSQSTT